MTQNDEAWAKIFDSLRLMPVIDLHCFVSIRADDIKKAGDKRESRLQ